MIDLDNNTIDIDLFKSVLTVVKNNNRMDIIDSFSNNQFKSKLELIHLIQEAEILNNLTNVTIWGCWYGSLLVPLLAPIVNNVIMIDRDDEVIRIGKNKLFQNYENVSWSTGDIFEKWRGDLPDTDLVINTSCEHMKPMNEWPNWGKMKNNLYFAFQTNNMFDIEDHINCVNTINEFKAQIPKNAEIFTESEIQDERGIRFSIVGRFQN